MTNELLQVLMKVQSELPVIKRDEKADAGKFSYRYASMPYIWEHIKNVIQTNGFLITHSVSKEGVQTVAHHEHGVLSSTIPFSAEGLDPQDAGGEITYYKRYNLCAIFNIMIDGEDDDAKNAQEKKKAYQSTYPQKPVYTPKQSDKTSEIKVQSIEDEQKLEIARLLKLDVSFQPTKPEDYQAQTLTKTGYELVPANFADIILVLEGKKKHKSTQDVEEIMNTPTPVSPGGVEMAKALNKKK